MAKRRSRKISKCLEPFNTLIDLAGAAALDYISYKRRQKHGYKKTKIDPYAATGVAFSLGKLETTEDILELGGMTSCVINLCLTVRLSIMFLYVIIILKAPRQLLQLSLVGQQMARVNGRHLMAENMRR